MKETSGKTSFSVRSIFVGRFGLRAGWSLILFVALLMGFGYGVGTAMMFADGTLKHIGADHAADAAAVKSGKAPEEFHPKGLIRGEAVSFVSLVMAAFCLSLIERRRMSVYGIGIQRVGDFLPGTVVGVAAISLIVFMLLRTHVLVFDARALSGSSMYLYGMKWLLGFLLLALAEEYIFRGFVVFTLTRGLFGLASRMSKSYARGIAFGMAALLMAIAGAAAHLHNPGESYVSVFPLFLLALVRLYALWRTGSLWWAIGFHMAWDWSQSFLFGVPDSGNMCFGRLFLMHATGNPMLSGGSVGPEASVFVFPVLLLLVIAVRFTTKPGVQPPLAPLQAR